MGMFGGSFGKIVGTVAGAFVAGGGGALLGYLQGSAYDEQKKSEKLQKQAIEEQRKILAKQQAIELENRKQLINQQREQMNIGGFSTYGTSQGGAGIRGYIGDKLG